MTTYSQENEYEIISELFEKLLVGNSNSFVCEFGAWDGYRYSNVVDFGLSKKFDVVFIEGDPKKYNLLESNFSNKKNFFLVKAYVEHQGENTIEEILEGLKRQKSLPAKSSLALLSIDIDGDEVSFTANAGN